MGMWQRIEVAVLDLGERRLFRHADLSEEARAAGVEDAARGRVGGARDLPFEPDARARLALRRRNRGEERLRVRMVRAGVHGLGGPDLHEPAQVQHRDPVGEVADDTEVVGDEDVRDALRDLHVGQQVEDRGLHGDVEGRGRLVAHDDSRVAGEGSRDRDPLLETAGELHRLGAQQAGVEAHGRGELSAAAAPPARLGARAASSAPVR